MKALKIDVVKKDVYEVEITRDINSIYKHLECECFAQVGRRMQNGDILLVDDNGLLNPSIGSFKIGAYPNSLSGHGILIGTDEVGETVDASSTIESLRNIVRFEDVAPLPKPEIKVIGFTTE